MLEQILHFFGILTVLPLALFLALGFCVVVAEIFYNFLFPNKGQSK